MLAFTIFQETAEEAMFLSITEDDVKPLEFTTFFREVLKESDRAFAIVSQSYIDARMRELLARAFNPQIAGGVDSLLGSLRPLSTYSARIQIAAALFWLNRHTYDEVSILRKIRNEFAHNPSATSLTEPRIAGLFSSMFAPEEKLCAGLPSLLPPANTLRIGDKLRLRTLITAASVIAELTIAPRAVEHGIKPLSPMRRENWDKYPSHLKDLWTASMQLFAEYCRDRCA